MASEQLRDAAAVSLAIKDDRGEQGIRTMGFDPSRGVWLIVAGNATSASKARSHSMHGTAMLKAWSVTSSMCGSTGMRVEGVTHASVGGRGAIVFVDDGGGYRVLWDDDPRLK